MLITVKLSAQKSSGKSLKMPELKIEEVVYSDRALTNAVSIKKYLLHKFTEKEVDYFYSLLASFESAVTSFPKLYPTTNKKKNIRRLFSVKYSPYFTELKIRK